MYKIIEAQNQGDENKVIEKTFTVEQKEIFTIAQIKNEIAEIDNQIANWEKRKTDLLAKISEVTVALDLKVGAEGEEIKEEVKEEVKPA